MAATVTRTLCLSALLGLALAVGQRRPAPTPVLPPTRERVAFVIGGLSDEDIVSFTINAALRYPAGVVLVDTPGASAGNHAFLRAYRPKTIVPVGTFPTGLAELERRLGEHVGRILPWTQGPPAALWAELFPNPKSVVVCPASPRPLLLQAACLAGSCGAPLWIANESSANPRLLGQWLARWRLKEVFVVGQAHVDVPGVTTVQLPSVDAVASARVRLLAGQQIIENLLIANPDDSRLGYADMSAFAPWIALRKRAALLLTTADGRNVRALVNQALDNPALGRADTVIFLADLKAIPLEHRPNPVEKGKDPYIEMEPLTPTGAQPFTFAIGRLFHADRGFVPLLVERQRLLAGHLQAPRALVVSDPGGGLPFLEAFSKNTARELLQGGYDTTALVGKAVTKEDVRRLLPEQDIFLWEGHFNTLAREYRLPDWPEPLRPSLVFLQSCMALNTNHAPPFLERGALGVVGSSTRTYSGTGGACSLAFFDALLYEGLSVGASLRHAKNFLLACALLKEKRLGENARLTGANIRSAWAFSIWGDPTLSLARPDIPQPAEAVHHAVHGNTIVVTLPEAPPEPTPTARYLAQARPNERLAGLVRRDADGNHRIVPLVFAEVHLPHGPPGAVPQIHSRLPSRRWVFCWDSRRSCGYLLAVPREIDQGELRFHVRWHDGLNVRSEDGDSPTDTNCQ